MQKLFQLFVCIGLCMWLCSCGHNVYTSSKGIGVDVSWSGENYIPNVRAGEWDVVNFVPRGNAAMTTTTASGGALGIGGTSLTVTVKTGPQLNEGNIVDICKSPFTSEQVKLAAVQTIQNVKPLTTEPTIAKTQAAVGGTGPEALSLRPGTSGLDKIIETAGDNIAPIKDTVIKAVDTTQTLGLKAISATKIVVIIAVIVIVIGLIILAKMYFGKDKTSEELIKDVSDLTDLKNNKETTDSDDSDALKKQNEESTQNIAENTANSNSTIQNVPISQESVSNQVSAEQKQVGQNPVNSQKLISEPVTTEQK